MTVPARLSYGVLALTLVLAGWVHLGPPLLGVLFSYFVLQQLRVHTKRKWLALVLIVLVAGPIAFGAAYFTRAAIRELPEIADSSLPSASPWAKARQIELPLTAFDSLK